MSDRAALVALLRERLEAVDARLHRCPDAAAACAALRSLVAEGEASAHADGATVRGFVDPAAEALVPGLAAAADLPALAPETSVADLAGAAIAVTAAACLVAETASALITAGPTPVRTASILARRHVVVARAADLVPDLATALSCHPPGRSASWACLVTGPSRTADIEKSLVLGAHGPLALDVLLME